MTTTCPDCTGTMAHEILPRSFGRARSAHVLSCSTPGCGYRHPALASGMPKGVPVSADVRKARMDCESVFDPLWREAVRLYDIEETDAAARDAVILRIKTTAKARTYRFIAHQLGIEPKAARIENITDLHTLKKFWHAANNASAEQVRDWAKAQKQQDEGMPT